MNNNGKLIKLKHVFSHLNKSDELTKGNKIADEIAKEYLKKEEIKIRR